MRLTRRQRDVVALLAARLSCPQIASRLGISVKTVYHHIAAVDEKLAKTNPRDPDIPALRWVRRHASALLDAA